MEPLLVVLDLDETLVYASDEGLLEGSDPDFYVGQYPVYKRPHVDSFLRDLFQEFRVAVWTSSSPSYAWEMVSKLFGSLQDELLFVWDSSRCTQKFDPEKMEWYWLKNLKKAKRRGFDLSRTVAVDDTPLKYKKSYGNLVRMRAFEGGEDDWLPALLKYLRWLNNKPDVRTVEKRGWKTMETCS
jgi:RNA polymerase II subunit A small phosphatase-like protein